MVATSRNRLNIEVTGSVAAINRAFHVTMTTYQHPTENRTFFSPDREPTVDLPFQLWHIAGLSNYSIPHPAGLTRRPASADKTSNATTGSGPSASFLGSDMRAAYSGGTSLTGSGQSLGLLEYYGTDLADLQTYYTNAHQTYPGSIVHLSPPTAPAPPAWITLRRQLRRHRADPRHDPGSGHGARAFQPRRLCRIH